MPSVKILSVLRNYVPILALAILNVADAAPVDLSKRQLEHSDYDSWNTLAGAQLSRDGKWVMYSVVNGAADGESVLCLQNLESGGQYRFERGSGARITSDSRHALFRVTPEKKKLKELRQKKTPAAELPQSTFHILDLQSGQVTKLEGVQSFTLPEENADWVACWLEKPEVSKVTVKRGDSREIYEVTENGLERPAASVALKSRQQLAEERGEAEPTVAPETKKAEKKTAEEKAKTEEAAPAMKNTASKKQGSPLMLIHLKTGVQRVYPDVSTYSFAKHGEAIAFATSVKADDAKSASKNKKKGDAPEQPVDGVHVVDLRTMKLHSVLAGPGSYANFSFSENASFLAFITDRDDIAEKDPAWGLYLWKFGTPEARSIAAEGRPGVPPGWWVSPDSRQRFSEDGKRLYFDTAPVPPAVVKRRKAKASGGDSDEEKPDDKAKLDVWHWQDAQLQPQQLLQAERERKRSYRAAYVLKTKKVVQLASREVPSVSIDDRSPANMAVGRSNVKYRKSLSWDTPGFQDIWLIDLDTGERQLSLEKVKFSASMSPEGQFLTWFDSKQNKWFARSVAKPEAEPVEISRGIGHPMYNELHDTPNLPRAYGSAGWLVDDKGFVVYDGYDMWLLDPTGESEAECLTNGYGREHEIRFRYRRLDSEERAIDLQKSLMLEAFDMKTKASGYFALKQNPEPADAEPLTANHVLKKLIMLDERLSGLRKAKESHRVVFTRSTFRMCPDLWSSNLEFQKVTRVSDINPQQDEFSWGTAELVQWQASDGQDLDGLLLKPDDFDPSRKYPLMVYFYERNSDNLHSYYTPAAGRSIICHSFYVSRGYVVFIPDIPYQAGEPGPSASNAVLPGVEHLIAQGFIDRDRVGMQGHSWGGYQAAYL